VKGLLLARRAFLIQYVAETGFTRSCISGRVEQVHSSKSAHFSSREELGQIVARILMEKENRRDGGRA